MLLTHNESSIPCFLIREKERSVTRNTEKNARRYCRTLLVQRVPISRLCKKLSQTSVGGGHGQWLDQNRTRPTWFRNNLQGNKMLNQRSCRSQMKTTTSFVDEWIYRRHLQDCRGIFEEGLLVTTNSNESSATLMIRCIVTNVQPSDDN